MNGATRRHDLQARARARGMHVDVNYVSGAPKVFGTVADMSARLSLPGGGAPRMLAPGAPDAQLPPRRADRDNNVNPKPDGGDSRPSAMPMHLSTALRRRGGPRSFAHLEPQAGQDHCHRYGYRRN